MIVPALSNWIFFTRGCEGLPNGWNELPTLEGSGRISRYNRRSLCCRTAMLLRITSTAKEYRQKLHLCEAQMAYSMKARFQGCAYPVALFCSDG